MRRPTDPGESLEAFRASIVEAAAISSESFTVTSFCRAALGQTGARASELGGAGGWWSRRTAHGEALCVLCPDPSRPLLQRVRVRPSPPCVLTRAHRIAMGQVVDTFLRSDHGYSLSDRFMVPHIFSKSDQIMEILYPPL